MYPIWTDPERMGGKPCFSGTRVLVRTLFEYLEGGDTIDDFLQGFPTVGRDQIVAVLEMACASVTAIPTATPLAVSSSS